MLPCGQQVDAGIYEHQAAVDARRFASRTPDIYTFRGQWILRDD